MIDFVDEFYYGIGADSGAVSDYDCARKKATAVILPFIMKNELSKRQYVCIKYRYDSGKSQREIAQLLNLSQSTVSRHIATGKDVLNKRLAYCNAAVTAALNEYERLERYCV